MSSNIWFFCLSNLAGIPILIGLCLKALLVKGLNKSQGIGVSKKSAEMKSSESTKECDRKTKPSKDNERQGSPVKSKKVKGDKKEKKSKKSEMSEEEKQIKKE